MSNGNNASAGGNDIGSCESPGVYLPTEAQRSPADDWSDWTSFTLELEVHPTTGADGSSLRCASTPFFVTHFCLGSMKQHLVCMSLLCCNYNFQQQWEKEQGAQSSVRDSTWIRARCHTIGRLARRSLIETAGHCRQTHARRSTSPRIRSRAARLTF